VEAASGSVDNPDQVLPFELDRAAAWDAILNHMANVQWAHPDLALHHQALALTKVWVPAWVYRGSYEGQYGALSVMKYTVTQKQGTFGREKPAGSREDAHPVTGTIKNTFALSVVTGEAGTATTFVDANATAVVEGLRPASVNDLEGAVLLPAESAASGADEAWRRAGEERMRAHAVESVKEIVSGNEVRDVRVQVTATWTAARVWLPMWRLAYRFEGESREVVVDGRRAAGAVRLQGELPLDEAAKKRHDDVEGRGQLGLVLGGFALVGGVFVGHEVAEAAGWGLAATGILPLVYAFRRMAEATDLLAQAQRERVAARDEARTRPVPA
jgi:hypothetical protein